MNPMKNISNKNVFKIVFSFLLLAGGVFFAGSITHASTLKNVTATKVASLAKCDMALQVAYADKDCEYTAPVTHTTEACESNNNINKKASPVGNTFMPCCLQRRDNSETTVPSALQDRIKFSEYTIVDDSVSPLVAIEQKTYLSSKSPPKKADILSSVVLKE